MVRMERLELSRLAALEPKSSVYTNFTTSANKGVIIMDTKDLNSRNLILGLNQLGNDGLINQNVGLLKF